MCLFHKWTKWRPYLHQWREYVGTSLFEQMLGDKVKPQAVDASEWRQRRECERCGKTQDELIRE